MILLVVGKLGYHFSFWLLDRYLPVEAFAIGGLLVLYIGQIQTFRLAKAIMSKPASAFAIAMLALLVTAALRTVKPFSYVLLTTWPLLYSLYSAVMILSGLGKARFFFAAEWVRKLGIASYTVYLFQQFALGPWAENYGRPFSWLAWSGLVAGVAILLPLWYAFVEKPLTEVGAKWFPRVAHRPPLQNFVTPAIARPAD
jgi:peptidoglycan/LPS O-acetylase OafA/YrhL